MNKLGVFHKHAVLVDEKTEEVLRGIENKSAFIREAVIEKISRPFDPEIVEGALRGEIRDIANPQESKPKMAVLAFDPFYGYQILAVYEAGNKYYPLSEYGETWRFEEARKAD